MDRRLRHRGAGGEVVAANAVPVQFIAGGHGSGDTTWNALGTTIETFTFSSLSASAQVGDLAVIVLVRDATFTPDAQVATPSGWTLHFTHQFFPKYLQMWTRVLDASSLSATHTLTAVQDADNSKAWAVFRYVGSLDSGVQGHPTTDNPTIAAGTGAMAYTIVFETLNGTEPSAGTATKIGYSGTIRWEANLGTYYKSVGPTDTDGGVGTSGGFRYTVVLEAA